MKSNFVLNSTLKGLTALGFLSPGLYAADNLDVKKHPNIVIIQADDQGMGDWSWFGEHPYLAGKTPNIEQIAKEGVFMTNFHAMPLCAPSRAALQTGRHSYFSRVWQGRHLMRAGLPTLGDLFKLNGYKTAIFGKWHLGHEYPYGPEFRGYDESIIIGGGMVMTLEDYPGNNGMTLTDLTLRHNGKFEKFKGYSTDLWFGKASEFIEKNKDKNFFVLITTDAPHAPHVPPKRYMHAFDNVKQFLDLQGKAVKDIATVKGFYGQILGIDEDFGKLRKKIKDLGLEENTVIIYTSDNGSAVAANIFNGSATHYPNLPLNLTAGKAQSQEGGHRVPFFVYWKGHIEAGKSNNELVHSIDLIPTLIDLCNLKKTPFDKGYLEGQSFADLLFHPDKKFKNHNYYRFATYCPIYDAPTARGGVVMRNNFRLFAYGALFDVDEDITQNYQYEGSDAKRLKEELFAALDKKQYFLNKEIFPFSDPYYVGCDFHPVSQMTAIDWNVNHPPGFWGDLVHWNDKKPDGSPVRALFGNYLIKPVNPGIYKISLYRWFPEQNISINKSIWNSVPLNATAARLVIKGAGIDEIKNISDNSACVSFEVNLPVKQLEVDAKFIDDKGEGILSAYFLRVERIKQSGNIKPVAVEDYYKILQGQILSVKTLGLLINDSDAEGDNLSVELVKNVSHGKLKLNSDGSFVYTPDREFINTDEFSYKISDGKDYGNTVPVKIDVISSKIDAPLMAYWKFDKLEKNNLIKEQTGSYNGHLKNGPAVLLKGINGECISFDKNKKQFVRIEKDVPVSNADFTVSVWIKLKSYTINGMDNRAIVGGHFAWVLGAGGKQHLLIPGKPGLSMQIKSSKTQIPLNTWTNIAVSYNDTTGAYKYYYNGKLDGEGVWKKHFNGNIKYIGKENDYFGFFNGLIDDLRIYKTALNDVQIASLTAVGGDILNHKPIACPEQFTIISGRTLNVDAANGVMHNDFDSDNDALEVKTVALPLYGKLHLNKDGAFSYKPNKNFYGVDTFDYCLDDGTTLSNIVTVNIKVK